ncbi:MAG TPA: VWA domain-containing protein, partial [Xanthomonadales bacterium]|nr:VWA domain-containing protein [Xanthomonadales bacterium]
SQPIEVQGNEASIQAPAEVPAGAPISFTWQGPGNVQDFITIVPAGAPDKDYDHYVYTRQGPSQELLAPEEPGDYELRYLTGQSNTVLARTAFRTTPVHASVHGPESVEAVSTVLVTWEGPGNPQDYVIIQPVGAKVSDSGSYAYTHRGSELRITAPVKPGNYEYRYVTGQSQRLLASQAVTVTPRNLPGKLRVSDSRSGQDATASSNVVVILDASGSMLQRLDGERRIDIAKASLHQLVSQDLPDNIQFGFRVFGHKEADSCRTDLEIPLAPLNRQQAAASVAGISAMNLAKTPIAATLQQAGGDLAGKSGPSLVILLTDGEETCDGDPAAVITSLRNSGLDVRVNIVGFAIDELMLRESFASWAALGGGQYIDARNAAELSAGLSSAIERPFEVFGADGNQVAAGLVNGLAVELPPGEYRLQVAGAEAQAVTVVADEEVLISLD